MKAFINGISIGYDDHGRGPAVVLVHGLGLNRRMWQHQIESLAGHGFRAIVPDLRGFGESVAPAGPFDMASHADDLAKLLRYLGIGRAVICGMSMGGYVLMELLERHPQRVAAAGFIATRCQADSAAEKTGRDTLVGMIMSGQRQATLKSFAQLLLARKTTPDHPELQRELLAWLAAADPRALTGALLAMRDRPDYTTQVRKFNRPALVVSGDMDQAIHPKHSSCLAASLPLGSNRVISGAGHLANLEQPGVFNQYLLDFLRRLKAARPRTRR